MSSVQKRGRKDLSYAVHIIIAAVCLAVVTIFKLGLISHAQHSSIAGSSSSSITTSTLLTEHGDSASHGLTAISSSSTDDGGSWTCLSTCCWQRQAVQQWPYQGNVPGTPNGMDLTHTDSFKALADIVVFNLVDPVARQSVFQGRRVTPLDNRTAPCLQPSTIIFVQSHWFDHFAKDLLPLVKTHFVLVSHDGDVVLPGNHPQARAMLDDPRLIHWFAMSCASDHPKLTCLPLGPSLWKMNGDMNNFNLLAEVLRTGKHGLQQGIFPSPLHPKSPNRQMLVNFNLGNHRSRAPLWRLTCNSSDAQLRDISTCLTLDYGRSMKDFYAEIAAHRFVLSPRGAGPDAYRTWETLLLGSYPIVPQQDIDHLYAGLPVLALKDIERDITPQLLDDTYKAFSSRSWEYHSMYIGHWYNRIYHHRHGTNKQYRFVYKYNEEQTPVVE